MAMELLAELDVHATLMEGIKQQQIISKIAKQVKTSSFIAMLTFTGAYIVCKVLQHECKKAVMH